MRKKVGWSILGEEMVEVGRKKNSRNVSQKKQERFVGMLCETVEGNLEVLLTVRPGWKFSQVPLKD